MPRVPPPQKKTDLAANGKRMHVNHILLSLLEVHWGLLGGSLGLLGAPWELFGAPWELLGTP